MPSSTSPGPSDTPGPEHHRSVSARIATASRAHPALVLVVAVLALAAAAAAGYIIHARTSPLPPATTAGAPVVTPGLAGGEATVRDTIVWRDAAGAIYRAKVDGERLDQFLRLRKAALEAARTQSRDEAAAEVLAALKPVFAEMTARVPGYADWYFDYLTKYELMVHAFFPAIDYLGRVFDFSSPPDKSLVQTIGPHVVEYLEQQYAERVVKPREAEIRLRAGFDKSYDRLRARWERIVEKDRVAMRAFIREQTGIKEPPGTKEPPGNTEPAGAAERLSADQARGLELDWDASRAQKPAMHEEGLVDKSFRRGLLSVTLKIPKSAKPPEQPDTKGKTPEEADEITHVIVNLFDKLIGPVVSQMSDLAIGVFAGSAAGGSTVGFGMAGGLGMGAPPAAFATGVATAVPIGAVIGLAATVAAEMLSNRLEASLNRAEFEESLRQTVDATENAIESGIIAALHEHVEAWYGDIVNPVAVK